MVDTKRACSKTVRSLDTLANCAGIKFVRGHITFLTARLGSLYRSCNYAAMIDNNFRLIIVFTGIALFAYSSAFAQSGTIGGSLGKTNKSVSGKVKKQKPTRKSNRIVSKKPVANTRQDNCRSAIGSWLWTNFGSTTVVTFSANGNTTTNHTYHGPWKCRDGHYTVTWQNGFVETFTVSSNGKNLTGRNPLGGRISGKRM